VRLIAERLRHAVIAVTLILCSLSALLDLLPPTSISIPHTPAPTS
jgi:hypothetical protein